MPLIDRRRWLPDGYRLFSVLIYGSMGYRAVYYGGGSALF